MPPSIRTFLLGLLAVGAGVLAQLWLLDGQAVAAGLLYAGAAGFFVGLFRRTGAGRLVPLHDGTPPTNARTLAASSVWRVGGALFLTLLATTLAVLGLREFHLHEPWSPDAWRYYGGSVAVMLAAAFMFTNPQLAPLPHDDDAAVWPNRRFIVLSLALIALLGLGLRLYRFESLPFGTWYDEAENGLQALRLLEDANFRPIFANSTHAPAHYVNLIAGAFSLFGVSTQSIRLVSVVMGMGTILGGYLVGRELFGRVAGLSTAFLLAVSRWDINLSRMGMYNISTPLFALLSIGFLLRGLRRRALSDFGLAGLFLGLGLAFYAAFQLIAAAMALFGLLLIFLEPRALRRYWLGLLLMAYVALLVIAPVAQFAYDHPDIYFDRTQDTSIFANKAQAEWLPALTENTRRHLLMFNLRGDPNGRHNLPGAPMLDPVSGALLVLGLALALWRWREPRWLLLPLWLGVALLGGILSLDFEAPQSLRAVGALPAVYLLAAGAIHLLWLAWSREGGRYYPAFFGLVVALLLLPAARYDARLYFHDQARNFAVWNAFSTPESITADRLQSLEPGTDAYISALFNGHPTLRFRAPDAAPYARLETDARFPLPVAADRGLLLMIDADRRAQVEALRNLYPAGRVREHRSPYGGAVSVYEVELTPGDLASIQGVEGAYFANADWDGEAALSRRESTLNFDWRAAPPLAPPFSAEWTGVLRVPKYGEYDLELIAPGISQLWLDEVLLLSSEDTLATRVTLAEGNHQLRVRAAVRNEADLGRFRLAWQPREDALNTIPASALYSAPVAAQGLLGAYYANDGWVEPAALERIDPQLDLYFHITPLARPYTVEWTGKIAIPVEGRYAFGLESRDESTLWINDVELTASPGADEYREATVELADGLHDIRVRFADRSAHTRITLYWQPPWGVPEAVPAAVLLPPLGSYDDIELPTVAELTGPPQPAPSPPGELSLPILARPSGTVMLDGLRAPKGLAAHRDGRIFVADTGNGRIVALDEAGDIVMTIPGLDDALDPATHFVEPTDLAFGAGPAGGELLYVLDSQLGRLLTIDPITDARTLLPIAATYLERARGLFVADFVVEEGTVEEGIAEESTAADGTIWIAHTPGGRVLAFTLEGELRQEIILTDDGTAQPVDVAVSADGSLYVTDAGTAQLLRFTPDGLRADAWPIPAANSLEGPHLAVDADGRILMTEPEHGRVVRLDDAGNTLLSWQLPPSSAGPPKPVGITVAADGRVWIVDSALGQVVRLD